MEMNYNVNQDHRFSNWWWIAAIIITFVLGVIVGGNRCGAQTPAIVKGYVGTEYMVTHVYADYNLSEDNRELDLNINGDTIHFTVWKEKMTILEDSVIRTEYILDKKSIMIIEPAYDSGEYIGDYCKMIMRNSDIYDKITITFWAEPKWEEDIARYQ